MIMINKNTEFFLPFLAICVTAFLFEFQPRAFSPSDSSKTVYKITDNAFGVQLPSSRRFPTHNAKSLGLRLRQTDLSGKY